MRFFGANDTARFGHDSKRAINETPALKEAVDNDEEYAQIFALAEKVEGLPRNIGTHAGGVLIAPKPSQNFVRFLPPMTPNP